jgi:methylamine dehydrogenase light chain
LIVKLGAVIAGTAAVPLLPVMRIGRAQADALVPARSSKSGPTWDDPKNCDYWAYCATDGWLCSGCGGTASKCAPGTEASPVSWVGTCKNPGDGKSYVISYNDCCGKSQCQSSFCSRDEGDTPRYRPQRSNAITWCYGGVSSTYHCTVSRLMSVVES